MAPVGSPAWVAETRGALRVGDQVRFVAAAVVREVGALFRTGRGRVLDADRTPPDTPLVQQVAAVAGAALPTPLLQHSIRSWLWASMLAEVDGIQHDDELLYVAALLHDVALSDPFRPGDDAACFAVHGGEVARGVVLEAGGRAAFAEDVADAIAAHFNVRVPLSWGAEAHLLHAGTHVDVVGLRLSEIAPSTAAEVLARVPRSGFAECFLAAMSAEARLRRSSRAGLLWRLGMERTIRRTRLPGVVG